MKLREGNILTPVCQSFCPQEEGGLPNPPEADPPLGRHPPRQTPPQADTPLGRHPPPGQTPLRQTPLHPGCRPPGRPPRCRSPDSDPPRYVTKRVVHILLECILVIEYFRIYIFAPSISGHAVHVR